MLTFFSSGGGYPTEIVMITQNTFWGVLDAVAERNGMALSTLGKRIGMDKTSLLPSKRVVNGEMRWPSTKTLADVLNGMNVSVDEFAGILTGRKISFNEKLPAITLSSVMAGRAYRKDGEKNDSAWEAIEHPMAEAMDVWVLIVDRAMPGLKEGSKMFLRDNTEIRSGDTVLVASENFSGIAKMRRMTATTTAVTSTANNEEILIPSNEVRHISRVQLVEV